MSTRGRKYQAGDRFGELVLVEYVGRRNGSTRVLARCDCGNRKVFCLQNLANGVTRNCADRRYHPDPRRTPPETHDGWHKRMRRALGPAKQYTCMGCGLRPAHDWAYDWGSHEPRADEAGREAGQPWVPDVKFYIPLCRRCHSRWDRGKREKYGDGLSGAHIALHMIRTSGEELGHE